MAKEKKLHTTNYVKKHVNQAFKEIMELFQQKGYMNFPSYLEATDNWYIEVNGIPGIKSFTMNHPACDFFRELIEKGFITISYDRPYYIDPEENAKGIKGHPIPMRISFMQNDARKKAELMELLERHKESAQKVHNFSEHIERWKRNIVQLSEDTNVSDEKQMSDVSGSLPDVPLSPSSPKLPSASPDDEKKHESAQETVRSVKQKLIDLVKILKEKNYICAFLFHDGTRQYLGGELNYLTVDSYVKKGRNISSCVIYKLLDIPIKKSMIDVERIDLPPFQALYKNKEGLLFERYLLSIEVKPDACTQEITPSSPEIFETLKKQAEEYPDFEKLIKVNQQNLQDKSQHERGKHEDRNFLIENSMFGPPNSNVEQQDDENKIKVEMQELSQNFS